MKIKRLQAALVMILCSGFIAGLACGQSLDSADAPWIYVGPFDKDAGLTWRSLLGTDSAEVLENSILIALMAIITIATLRTNYRLKQSRQELENSNRRLKHALKELESKEEQIVKQERLRALGEMAGGVAHDFNNALQPIVLAADVLNRRKAELSSDPKLQGYVQAIHMASREAVGTVRRLVRFFRPGKGHDKKLFDAGELIEEVFKLTRPKWKEDAQMNGVMIDFEIDPAPDCEIYGYPDEFREMLVNLVFNAVDAIEHKGRILISTVLEAESVLLKVSDDGCGMAHEVSSKCLEPFFTTKANRGTGLGLSIVYGVVRRLKGGIYIDSRPGEGTTFTIRIPRAGLEGEGERGDSDHKLAAVGQEKKNLKFLLAEDNAAVRSLLYDQLQQQGWEVVLAVSGNQAWGLYQKNDFDMVITDQAMPGMSGKQLARLIKERDPQKPILMLTGFGDMVISDDGDDCVDKIISKPVSLEEILLAISSLFLDE